MEQQQLWEWLGDAERGGSDGRVVLRLEETREMNVQSDTAIVADGDAGQEYK